jgi:hypothetical protein
MLFNVPDLPPSGRPSPALDFVTSLNSVEVLITPQGDGAELGIVRSAVSFE